MTGILNLFAIWAGLTAGGIVGTAFAVWMIMRRGDDE